MDLEYSRTVSEIIARYELEPTLRDIFVEGKTDKFFVEWVLEKSKNENVRVYEINDIVISDDEVFDLEKSLNKNNRQKAIKIAHIISKQISGCKSVIFIIDSDFDIVLKVHHNLDILFLTDYANLEMYLYNKKVIHKFSKFYLRGFPKETEFIIEQIKPTLQNLFLIRLTVYLLKWKLEHIPPTKLLEVENFKLRFNLEEFIKRYLNSNNLFHQIPMFKESLDRNRMLLTSNPKNQINGHDFINVLRTYIQKSIKSKKKFCDDYDIVCGALYNCLEFSDVADMPLISKIIDWLKA